MSLIKSSHNACALSAVSIVREDLDEKLILDTFTKHGYSPSSGSHQHTIEKSLRDLGVQFTSFNKQLMHDRFYKRKGKAPTTAEFARGQGAEGVWYVCTSSHAFNIIDGIPVDPYYEKPQLRGRIVLAYRIDNPVINGYRPVKEQLEAIKQGDTVIKLVVGPHAKNHGSQRHQKYTSLWQATEAGKVLTTVEKAAKEHGYSRTDIAWDIKKGHIRVVR